MFRSRTMTVRLKPPGPRQRETQSWCRRAYDGFARDPGTLSQRELGWRENATGAAGHPPTEVGLQHRELDRLADRVHRGPHEALHLPLRPPGALLVGAVATATVRHPAGTLRLQRGHLV